MEIVRRDGLAGRNRKGEKKKMKKQLVAGLACGVMMLGIVNIAKATTYNALNDFSTTSPVGVWSYGEGATGSSFYPLYNYISDPENYDSWWSSQGWIDSGLPIIARRTAGTTWAPTIPDGFLVIAPAGNGTHSDVIVQWTAPHTAVYDISWTFSRENNGYSDGVNALVFNNSTKVYEAHLGPNDLTSSSLTLSLTDGDVLSFGINDAGWGNGDTSGFNAIITPLPPDVSGCFSRTDFPVANRKVILRQNSTQDQTSQTDEQGCYSFASADHSKPFSVTIQGDWKPASVPAVIQAVALTNASVQIDWQYTPTDATSFNIYRKKSASGAWILKNITGPDDRSYIDTTFRNDINDYYYYIKACNAAGCSSASDTAGVTLP